MHKYKLKLFVTGQTPRSQRAIRNLRRLCEEDLPHQVDLTVIDVLQSPQLAEDAKVIATPTLVKETPLPARRLVGDLSDTESLLMGLDIEKSA